MAERSPWYHPDPPMRINRPDPLEGPDEEEISDEDLETYLAIRTEPRHRDNRGMSPSLGGEEGQQA